MLPRVYMNYISNQDDEVSAGIVSLASIKKITLSAFYLVCQTQKYIGY